MAAKAMILTLDSTFRPRALLGTVQPQGQAPEASAERQILVGVAGGYRVLYATTVADSGDLLRGMF